MRINFTNHLKVTLVLAKAPGRDLHCDLSFFSISASLLKFIFLAGGRKIYILSVLVPVMCVFSIAVRI